MQIRKVCSVGVEGEHRSLAEDTSSTRSSVQGVARYSQIAKRIGSLAVGRIGAGSCGETMEDFEGLRCHATSQHQAESGNQHAGQKRTDIGIPTIAYGCNWATSSCE